ncbi:O-antigen ligase family protein [Dasania sp. GY-MA-18]|uniref:O-antigen ligase family protein n=1 Tax=Dasania phycosphaerae TaxID=2950436 RepID=A0A9J6RQ34_9GAMM|nr:MULTISPECIES: O-antigen ligase family protein [Dasania]MCR8924110.1 O-antigen ligase family protein [Dasania sp. GY-MA-18]MCZ0866683.1 O-antigen ligase family protein [Dasania phycosphaerae]MCZ0870268.1 O-antigen ligase family protein [Dasania phycosphaerae]
MRSIVVLIFTAYFMIMAMKSSFVAMLLYWWFAIFRPQDWIWWDVSILRLPLIAALIFFIPALFRGYVPRIKDKLSLCFLLWIVIALIANFTNGCTVASGIKAAIVAMPVLIYTVLLTERVIETKAHVVALMLTIALSLGFHSGKSGVNSLLQGGVSNYGAENLTGLFSGSNAYALGTGMLVFFMIFIYQQAKSNPSIMPVIFSKNNRLKYFKIIMLIIIAGSIYNIVSLSSRGASLATFAGFVGFFMMKPNGVKHVLMILPFLVVSFFIIPLPEGYKERIESVFVEEEELDHSAKSRGHFWETAKRMADHNPVGIGAGCYSSYYDLYDYSNGFYGSKRSVHSSHFQILAETGYIGFIIWVVLFVVSYIKLFKLRMMAYRFHDSLDPNGFYKQISETLICAQTVFLLGGSFYELAYSDLIWLIWAVVICLIRLMNFDIENLNVKNDGKISRL